MNTIRVFQEASQSGGIGGYVWVALIIFFLMVFLGWLVSSKGWLKKEETTPNVEHAHDAHEAEHPQAEAGHSAAVVVEEKPDQTTGAAISAETAQNAQMSMDEQSDQTTVAAIRAEPAQTAPVPMDEQPVHPTVAAMSAEPAQNTQMPVDVQPAPVDNIAQADDLTLLEGIGPKVAKVLAGIGITTFDGLARADYKSLRTALDEVGYKYMEPAGWIDQAVLAAKGDSDGLKKLQDSLKGGRKAA